MILSRGRSSSMSNVDGQIQLKKPDISDSELAELTELLRIPSISADPKHAGDIRAAADWLVALFRAGGADAGIVERSGRPIVDALIRASDRADAPLVLCYGHFDVQSPAPLELWDSEPFSPEIRDGWLYARGVADDKGGLWALARSALDLSAAGELPVDVRFLLDCEEEIGGTSILGYLEETRGPAQACVIFDAPMLDDETPVLGIGTRGTLYLHVEVRTGDRDLHSGAYGGAALNALHVLVDVLARVSSARRPAARALSDRSAFRPTRRSSPNGNGCPAVAGCSPRKVQSPPTKRRRVSSISGRGHSPRST